MNRERLKSAKNLLFFALSADVAISAVIATADLWSIRIANDAQRNLAEIPQSTFETMKLWNSFSMASFLTMGFVGLALLRWIGACYDYSHTRLRASNFSEIKWKTWGWIIPIMNLFKPYQVLNEIYKIGSSIHPYGEEWKRASSSSLLLGWWIFWIITHVFMSGIANAITSIPHYDDLNINQIITSHHLSIAFSMLSIIISSFWFIVIGNLTRKLLHHGEETITGPGPQPSLTTATSFPSNIIDNDDTRSDKGLKTNAQIHLSENTFDSNRTGEQPPSLVTTQSLDEDQIYIQIAEELDSGGLDRGLWTRLFAEYDGDEKQIKVMYIKQRAERLTAIAKARREEQIARAVELQIARRESGGIADPTLVDAVWSGNWTTVNKLLRDGVKPVGLDANGKSLLDLASERGDKQMINLLRSYGATDERRT